MRLDLERFSAGYGQAIVVRDVTLSVASGEALAIVGRNGMGKTTLLKCIMGLLDATGEMLFGSTDLRALPPERRARLGIGYVPQGREIFSHLTVEENLRVGLGIRNRSQRKVPDMIFELFPVLNSMLSRRGGDLSGGQQQQLAIGRALVLEPSLLILDEPTEGIQPNIVHEIGDVLLRLNREAQMTILLVEQKLPFARRVASEFCILEKGRSVASGPIGALTDDVIHAHLSV